MEIIIFYGVFLDWIIPINAGSKEQAGLTG
jgi:hypothetical protein